MKKLLLSLLAVAGMSFTSTAETVTFVPEGSAFDGTVTTTIPGGECIGTDFVAGNITINLEKLNSNVSNVTGGMLRWYQNDKLHIVPATGTTITSIVIYAPASYSNNKAAEVKATGTEPATFTNDVAANGVITWAGAATDEVVVTSSKQVRFTALEITYTAGAAPAVERPVITCENNTVTITATGADAIYYTTDGSNPTAASTKYTAPFAITSNTSVKAVAQKGADLSSVATLQCVYEGNYADFASFIADKATGTVDGPISTIYQNGRYLYLKDAKGGFILCYNSADIELPAYTNGNVIASVTGSFKDQNGLPEILPSAVGATSNGTPVQPETVAIEELSLDMLNAYVKIEGVSIVAASSANNYEITDATGSAILYNAFYNEKYNTVVEVPEGSGFTIEGFVSVYSNKLQITPMSITGGTVEQRVEAPVFDPASCALQAGAAVTITCPTEGATIFYTTDGTEPTAASFQYTAPVVINEALTLSAIAIKEGMINSDVTKANYTIIDPNATTVTFDFTDPTSLTPAFTAAEPGSFVDVSGQTLTAGVVTMTIGEAATSNPPRLWTATGASEGAVDFRMYKGDTFTLDINDQYCITLIEFTKAGGNFAVTVTPGDFATDGNTATWTPSDNKEVKSIKFDATATTRISTMTVTYSKSGAGVGDILTDDSNAPAEYYNLQGVRVANPAAGNLYIVRQGNKVSKTIVR